MKRTAALGFALSLFSATATFAANESAHSAVATPAAANHSVERMATASNDAGKSVGQLKLDLSSNALVTENSPAFGSKYQRY